MRSNAAEPECIRDRFWIWAHEAGSYATAFELPGISRMTPVEGAFYLGVPNIIMVRYNDKPAPPYYQYAIPFRPLKQVVWSIVGATGVTEQHDRAEVLKLAARFPNITGVIMDDFFQDPEAGGMRPAIALDELRNLRQELATPGRKLDLWAVLYTHQLAQPVGPYLELCDEVTFWTWEAKNLKDLESNFQKLERLVPSTNKVLGCYMWDFGTARPMPTDLMRSQCELGLGWLQAGRIEGMIFLASPICDLELEAVEWTRRWIAEVGDERLSVV